MRGDATAEYMRLATSRGCKIGKATKLRLVAMEDWLEEVIIDDGSGFVRAQFDRLPSRMCLNAFRMHCPPPNVMIGEKAIERYLHVADIEKVVNELDAESCARASASFITESMIDVEHIPHMVDAGKLSRRLINAIRNKLGSGGCLDSSVIINEIANTVLRERESDFRRLYN